MTAAEGENAQCWCVSGVLEDRCRSRRPPTRSGARSPTRWSPPAAGSSTIDAEAERFVEQELSFAAGATYGGATPCVELEAGDGSYFICDMGSGLRPFGLDSMKRNAAGHSKTYNFFLSHLHWDHIMGFPFFAPAFDPNATIRIHAGHPDAEQALRRQQEEISFPVPFDWLRADIQFVPADARRSL